MEYNFYIGSGKDAKKLISALLARREEYAAHAQKIVSEWGAENLFYYEYAPEIPKGFVFRTQEERKGLEFGAAIPAGFTYMPDMATQEGALIAKALKDESLCFNPEIWILKRLGITGNVTGYCHHCRNVHATYAPVVLVGESELFMKIPEGLDVKIPDWFREVKESEWLATQGK